jgi:Rap1a immunity proteins
MKYLFSVLFAALSSTSAAADDFSVQQYLSGAFILDACKEVSGTSTTVRGVCIGEIQMLYMLAVAGGGYLGEASRFCPPNGVTIDQARTIVIRYIEDHPEGVQTPFVYLAIKGLRRAWPCPKP